MAAGVDEFDPEGVSGTGDLIEEELGRIEKKGVGAGGGHGGACDEFSGECEIAAAR